MTENETLAIFLTSPFLFWMLKEIYKRIFPVSERAEETEEDPETLQHDSINRKSDELSKIVERERYIRKCLDEFDECEPEKRLTSVSIKQSSDKPYTLLLDGSERSAQKYRELLETELDEIRIQKKAIIQELQSLTN